MKKFLTIIAFAALTACGGEDKKAEEVVKDQPLSQSQNSDVFNTQFSQLLSNYYHLKDALVLSNDTMAATSARRLLKDADSLNIKELKADPSIVEMAQGYLQSISAESKALINEKDLEAKRKSFQMVSDNMYDLVRTVRYDQAKVYHQYCPMAFDDAGAYWLSQSSDIKNPYYGKKMLSCGEVRDSIDFRAQ